MKEISRKEARQISKKTMLNAEAERTPALELPELKPVFPVNANKFWSSGVELYATIEDAIAGRNAIDHIRVCDVASNIQLVADENYIIIQAAKEEGDKS